MKPLKNILILLCSLLLLSASCKKQSKNPIDNLPPATQTGANTFGCLVNGEVWIPKGGLLNRELNLTYDSGYINGAFDIVAKRFLPEESSETFNIGIYNINTTGTFDVAKNKVVVYYRNANCYYNTNEPVNFHSGTLNITLLDLKAKIISGTFNFKLEKTGCPTIIATEGRFDLPIE